MNSVVVHSITEKYRDFLDSFIESIDKIIEYIIKENPDINIEDILDKILVIHNRSEISNIICTINDIDYIVEFKNLKSVNSAFIEVFDHSFNLYLSINRIIDKYKKDRSDHLSKNKNMYEIEGRTKFIKLNYGSTTK